ncbi:bifunctional hydroxymethylpyrimidine kinase/phosphomethylpyrimidine kinase [Qipengyuania sp. JC766]|uniref:bifunctional hydroxymethylpyrimidine kinase/phosphomethylpyrimidine kinase n=1 Tax=Qipengyuania sp. JC766 TaxID=3232139 RepID=UPI003457AF5F
MAIDYPRVLVIAGSDSSGGAGIQADIKTVTMLGGFATTAITAVTAQNTTGVQGVEILPDRFVAQQIESVLTDIGADSVKIGMLGSEDIVSAVADALAGLDREVPIVLDPVMVATSGSTLASDPTVTAMKGQLFSKATLLTPNVPELTALTGHEIASVRDLHDAALELAREYGVLVVAKGGHLAGDTVTDLLVEADGSSLRYDHRRIDSRHTHGTGCTLASAIATLLGRGQTPADAVSIARKFVYRAIEAAPAFGAGGGPMRHNFGR